MGGRFLPGVPGPQIEEILNAAPGNEIATGKFDSPRSSARLAANAFGFFLNRPKHLPPLPGCEGEWPAVRLAIEEEVRFPEPWPGPIHSHPDVLITTRSALIGVESKRFEPFGKNRVERVSDAYRWCWGEKMKGYESVRDRLYRERGARVSLNEAQLIKHAFALRTRVHREDRDRCLRPILYYVYAEPNVIPGDGPEDGTPIDEAAKAKHREEVAAFAREVAGDEVRFVASTYRDLMGAWQQADSPDVRTHAEAVIRCFSP